MGAEPTDLAELRAVLCQNEWSHTNRLGRVAIETQILVFDDDGVFTEQIRDDTGVHTLKGRWTLEQSSERTILTFEGTELRIRGRYAITYDPALQTIELTYADGGRGVTYERERKRP